MSFRSTATIKPFDACSQIRLLYRFVLFFHVPIDIVSKHRKRRMTTCGSNNKHQNASEMCALATIENLLRQCQSCIHYTNLFIFFVKLFIVKESCTIELFIMNFSCDLTKYFYAHKIEWLNRMLTFTKIA